MKASQLQTIIAELFSRILLVGLLFILITACSTGVASPTNGFEISGALVPQNEIFHGGPPRARLKPTRFLSYQKAAGR